MRQKLFLIKFTVDIKNDVVEDNAFVGFLHEKLIHQICIPITWPGGADTSIDCKQHGNQQLEQAKGRLKWITWFLCMSMIFMSKGRAGPQQLRVQQSFSSTAQ